MYYYHTMDTSNGVIGIMMMLFGFLFLIAIVAVTVRLLRHNEIHSGQRTKPLDMVKERYAKGEITKTEFDQVKKDLSD